VPQEMKHPKGKLLAIQNSKLPTKSLKNKTKTTKRDAKHHFCVCSSSLKKQKHPVEIFKVTFCSC
jgi:hypothetical protein